MENIAAYKKGESDLKQNLLNRSNGMNSFLKIIDETMTFVLKGETDTLRILCNQYKKVLLKELINKGAFLCLKIQRCRNGDAVFISKIQFARI